MSVATIDGVDTTEDRRAAVQQAATRFYRRKMAYSRLFLATAALGLVVAFIPLYSIVYNVLARGIPQLTWAFLSTPPQNPTLFDQSNIGGISNLIEGTVLIFCCAFAAAVPVAVVVAMALYESHGRVMSGFRTLLEVMVGMPSILFGIFISIEVVQHMDNRLTGLAGSLALFVLMIPLIAVTCEQAMRAVPQILIEAALALGAKPSQVMRRVVLPNALSRMLTGIMLTASRALGETAPLLFVIGSAYAADWNPLTSQSSLTTTIYTNLQSIYHSQRNEVWGIAVLLISVVFILNLGSKIFVARMNKGQQ